MMGARHSQEKVAKISNFGSSIRHRTARSQRLVHADTFRGQNLNSVVFMLRNLTAESVVQPCKGNTGLSKNVFLRTRLWKTNMFKQDDLKVTADWSRLVLRASMRRMSCSHAQNCLAGERRMHLHSSIITLLLQPLPSLTMYLVLLAQQFKESVVMTSTYPLHHLVDRQGGKVLPKASCLSNILYSPYSTFNRSETETPPYYVYARHIGSRNTPEAW